MEERIEESANLKSLVQSQEQQHHDAIRKLQRDKEVCGVLLRRSTCYL